MNREFTENEIQNVALAAEFIHKIKEKIALRKQVERTSIEWNQKDNDLTPVEQIRCGKVDAFQYIYINKKFYVAGA